MAVAEGWNALVGEGHHALVPTPPKVAGEVSNQRTVKMILLIVWLNELVLAFRRTSNWFALAPATRSTSTEVGSCA